MLGRSSLLPITKVVLVSVEASLPTFASIVTNYFVDIEVQCIGVRHIAVG